MIKDIFVILAASVKSPRVDHNPN